MLYVYDAISEGESVSRSSSILASNGRMAIMRSRGDGAWSARSLSIQPIYGAVWEELGKKFSIKA
jgi:hypothetical protein